MHYEQLFPRSCQVQTTDRFAKFQRLPPEIRNLIWEFALPEPRVYEVLDAPNAKQKTPAQEGLMFANVHAEPPPTLAAVCRESRCFVLHHYKPLTLGKTTKFVDMSRDILLLEPYLLVKRLHRTLHFMSQIPLVRDNATRLALGTSYGVYPGIFHPVLGRKVSKNNMAKLLSSLTKFPRLKTLIFVVHQEFQFEFDFRFPGTMTPLPHLQSSPLPGPPAYAVGPGPRYPTPPGTVDGRPTPPATGSLPSPLSHSSTITTTTTRSTSSPPAAPLLPFPPFLQTPIPPAAALSPQFPLVAAPPPPPPTPPTPPSLPPPAPPRPQQVHQAYRFKFDIEANINCAPRRPHTNELLYYPLDVREDREEDDYYYNYCNYYYHHGCCPQTGHSHDNAHHHHHHHHHHHPRCGNGVFNGGYGGIGTGGCRWDRSAPGFIKGVPGLMGQPYGGDMDVVGDEERDDDDDDDDDDEEGEWCDPWPTNDDWRRFRRRWVRAMAGAAAAAAASSGPRLPSGKAGLGPAKGGGVVKGRGRRDKAGLAVVGARGGDRVCLPRWRLKGASLLWRYTKGVGGVR